ncbi:DUF1428 domain-containing protein [Oceaniglobus indicus]|uniref:DUF1428 domain-containing protein n=1 Tax=Oceaniglobus indicus TaxID=2047749 RepID=UPI000C18103D|nr:DUF1428 domain-containing protein [Oceaniglobus indicus]
MYVDVMVAAVKTAERAAYVAISAEMGEIFRGNGALGYLECWGQDVPMGELTSFPRAVKMEADETCAVCVITYPDKATRDACMGAVMGNPRAEELMQSTPIDGKRMIFGGFDACVTL